MKTKKIGSGRSARTTALMRIGGLGLVVAVFVGPIAAQADGNGGSDVVGGVTSSVTGLLGLGGDSDAATPAEGSDAGSSDSDATDATTKDDAGTGGGRAVATSDGGDPLTSIGNSGIGSGNQLNLTTQVPLNVTCNGVGILGNADADCPVAPVDNGGGNGGHQGGGHKGGGYPGGGHPGGGSSGGGNGGGGYGPTPPPTTPPTTPPPTVTPTQTPTSPPSSVAGTTVASLPLTGSPSESIGYLGGGLLVLGGGLLFLARRRRVAEATATLGASRSGRRP